MVQVVNLPDGSQVNFPDDMSVDEIKTAMTKFNPAKIKPESPDLTKAFIDGVANSPTAAVLGGIAKIPLGIADLVHTGGLKLADLEAGDSIGSNSFGSSKASQAVHSIEEAVDKPRQSINEQLGTVKVPFTDNVRVGPGDALDVLGQGVSSLGALNKVGAGVSNAVSKLPGLKSVAGEGFVNSTVNALKKIPAWFAGASSAGALGGAIQPTEGATIDEKLGNIKDNATIGAIAGPVVEGGAKIVGGVAKLALDGSGEKKIAGELGKDLLEKLSPEQVKSLETASQSNPRNLTTAETTLNPDVAKLQREAASSAPIKNRDGTTINPANVLGMQNQGNKSKLAQELSDFGVNNADETGLSSAVETSLTAKNKEIAQPVAEAENAFREAQDKQALLGQVHDNSVDGTLRDASDRVTSPGIAAENTGTAKLNQDIANVKTIKDAYKGVDPDGIVPGDPKSVVDTHAELVKDTDLEQAIKFKPVARVIEKYLDKSSGAKSSGLLDSNGKPIPSSQGKSSKRSAVTVRQMVEDNAELAGIMQEQSAIMKQGPNQQASDIYEVASKLKSSIETALEASPVGADYLAAKQSVKDIEAKFYDNPNFKISDTRTTDSALVSSKEKLRTGGEVQPTHIGEQVFNPKTSSQVFANAKNIENGPVLLKEQALSNIASSIKKNPTVQAFDEVYTPEIQEGFLRNGMEAQHQEIMATREALKRAEGNVVEQKAILQKAELESAVKQDELEKSSFYNLVKAKGNPDAQIDAMLSNPKVMDEALSLAKSQDDNGASSRGIGKAVVERLRNQVKPSVSMTGENISKFDHGKFQEELIKHEKLLKETIPDEYEALLEINEVAKRLDFVNKYSKPEGPTGQKPNADPESPGDVVAKELSVMAGVRNFVANSIQRVTRGYTTNARNRLLLDITEPSKALSLIKAAKAEGEKGVRDWVTTHSISALTPAVVTDSEKKDSIKKNPKVNKRLDKEVDSVLHSPINQSRGTNVKTNLNPERNPSIKPMESPSGKVPQVVPAPTVQIKGSPQAKTLDNPHTEEAMKLSGMPQSYFEYIQRSETKGEKNPDIAQNPNPESTASGRYQFVESTWNDIAKKHPEANIPLITKANARTKNDPRFNERHSKVALGLYGKQNKAAIEPVVKAKGRSVTFSDILMAHKFGAGGFKRLLSVPSNTPAVSVVPELVKGNESLFFEPKTGKARSVKQLYATVENTIL